MAIDTLRSVSAFWAFAEVASMSAPEANNKLLNMDIRSSLFFLPYERIIDRRFGPVAREASHRLPNGL